MSLTGRPSKPPFLLTSSAHICIASNAALPLAARPPVSAMLKPILMGSAAIAEPAAHSAPAIASVMRTRRMKLPIMDMVSLVSPCWSGVD